MRLITDSVHGSWYTDNYKIGDLVEIHSDLTICGQYEVLGFEGKDTIVNVRGVAVKWESFHLSLYTTLEQRIEKKQQELDLLKKLL